MQKSVLLICILVTTLISSCGLNRHTAQEFCNKISGVNDTLDKLTTDWHNLLEKAEVTKNYPELRQTRIALGSFISVSRSMIASTPRTKETEKILAMEDALLETQSNMVSEVYPAFELYSEFTPKEQIAKSLALLGSDLMNEKEKVAEIKRELDVIAIKNDVKKEDTRKKKK